MLWLFTAMQGWGVPTKRQKIYFSCRFPISFQLLFLSAMVCHCFSQAPEPPCSTPSAGSRVPPCPPPLLSCGAVSSETPAVTRKELLLGHHWCSSAGQHSEPWGGPAQPWGLECDTGISWKINFLTQFEALESKHCLLAQDGSSIRCVWWNFPTVFIPSVSCTFIAKYFLAHTGTRQLLEATSRVLTQRGHWGEKVWEIWLRSGCSPGQPHRPQEHRPRWMAKIPPVSQGELENSGPTNSYSKAQVTEPKPFLLGLQSSGCLNGEDREEPQTAWNALTDNLSLTGSKGSSFWVQYWLSNRGITISERYN